MTNNLTQQIAERMESIALFEIAPGKYWQPDVDQLVPLAQVARDVIREWMESESNKEYIADVLECHLPIKNECRTNYIVGAHQITKAISQGMENGDVT